MDTLSKPPAQAGRRLIEAKWEDARVRVDVDMDLCQSHGECCFAAPEVFELGDDDVLRWAGEPDEALRSKVEQAVAGCPVQAITLHD